MKHWGIHVCPLNKHCRDNGVPWRVYVSTPRWYAYAGWMEFVVSRRGGDML